MNKYETGMRLGFDEQSPEKEKRPTLSIFFIRHGEAWPKSNDPKRSLTPEGLEHTKQTAGQIADSLGDLNHWLINQLDAKNLRAKQTSAALVEQLKARGAGQFFKPIKGGKGGLSGKEEAEVSDQPRKHTSVGSLARKIMTALVPEENGDQVELQDHYKKELRAKGIEHPKDMDLIQAWVEDEDLPANIETAKNVKESFLAAMQKIQNGLAKLKQALPEDKGIATIIGLNNPRMDLLVESITGISLTESLKAGEEITPRSQGVRIDFYLTKSPEFSVVGQAETSVAKKDEAGRLIEEREAVAPFEKKLEQWAAPRTINEIHIPESSKP